MQENGLVVGNDIPMGCADEQRPRCRCGAPSMVDDDCEDCLYAHYMAHPTDADDDMDNPRLTSDAIQRVFKRVRQERVRRFAAGVRVYQREVA
jgi:hypothetical protein